MERQEKERDLAEHQLSQKESDVLKRKQAAERIGGGGVENTAMFVYQSCTISSVTSLGLKSELAVLQGNLIQGGESIIDRVRSRALLRFEKYR